MRRRCSDVHWFLSALLGNDVTWETKREALISIAALGESIFRALQHH